MAELSSDRPNRLNLRRISSDDDGFVKVRQVGNEVAESSRMELLEA